MRIFLLTSHEPTRRALAHGLEQEGFIVATAITPKDAARQLPGVAPAVILLDLAVPGSLALLERYRDEGQAAHLLALIGRTTSQADRVRILEVGADGYVTKPVRVVELVARLRAQERNSRMTADPLLRVRDLVINTATKTVQRGGRTIRLTRREYALLHFLAVHRGRVVSRDMIRGHLYDDNFNTSNVISVFIRFLRQKIDQGFDGSLIITRWGQGYLMPSDA